MAQFFERRTVSFIVRLWVESGEQQNQPLWRGQIEHIGSGEKAHFQDLPGLQNTLAKFVLGFVSLGIIKEEEEV